MKYLNYKQSAKIILIIASLFFYGYFKIDYLPIIISSIIINYYIAKEIYFNKFIYGGGEYDKNKSILILGIVFNIGLLAVFKYTDFLLSNVNLLSNIFSFNIPLPHILLPLALSFITFQQIAFLCDCYNAKNKDDVSIDFIDYVLFILFFPQLIAGPIVHHKEMMPQFSRIFKDKSLIIYEYIAKGLFIFSIGLFKKVCIADSFAKLANAGFGVVESGYNLNLVESWVTSLSYTFQLYFDFSGYCDMAIGLALLFGIMLPINFNSPYKALNITDFWRMWHITLGRFLKSYLYIPLGGNKNTKYINNKNYIFINKILTLRNLFIVAFISGIWHGAGYGFIIWGSLHGIAMVIHRFYRFILESKNINKSRFLQSRFYKLLSLCITFNFINIAWIFFRSENVSGAMRLLEGMFSPVDTTIKAIDNINMIENMIFIIIAFIIVFVCKNSIYLLNNFKANLRFQIATSIMFYTSIFILSMGHVTRFLYFNF